MDDFIEYVPAPLLRQLVDGRWLPVVGAGFSRNARVPSGNPPPDWKQLGTLLAQDIPDLDYEGPLDAISAYQQAFERPLLVDRVGALLRINDARPSGAHIAFARLGFEHVVTTNFDTLLERASESVQRPCLPLVEESQLSNRNSYPGPRLLKIHGDINHPHRLVLTEDDYDGFLTQYPLLATSLSALLINHTAVLIGYSLDDPDMRQLLSVIRNRLGRLTPLLWAIQIDSPPHLINRFERRGVRVINIPKRRGQSYGDRLESLFDAIRSYWRQELIDESTSTDERALADLKLPPANSKICYFAVPIELLSWYREIIFPIVETSGFVPVAPRDVLTPPGTVATKIDALIGRAALVVVEFTGRNALFELGLALGGHPPDAIMLVADEDPLELAGSRAVQDVLGPTDMTGFSIAVRPRDLTEATDTLTHTITEWLKRHAAARVDLRGQSEPERLLANHEYRAALIAAIALLENGLSTGDLEPDVIRRISLADVVRRAASRGLIDEPDTSTILDAIRLRNAALHQGLRVTAGQAEAAVRVVMEVLRRL
jgi:SIR2-like domain